MPNEGFNGIQAPKIYYHNIPNYTTIDPNTSLPRFSSNEIILTNSSSQSAIYTVQIHKQVVKQMGNNNFFLDLEHC